MVGFLTEISARGAIWLAARMGYRLRIEGLENIPSTGAAVLICNHVSYLDWLFIQAVTGRPVRFVMDHAFFKGPLLTWVLKTVRVIPIAEPKENKAKTADAYLRIHEELARGELICLFPEGRITRDGTLGPFKPGILKILRKSPVPVVPVGIIGLWGSVASFQDGPPFRKIPKGFRRKVVVRIGKPVPASEATLVVLREEVARLLII